MQQLRSRFSGGMNHFIISTQTICPLCAQILQHPVQLAECGHRCCASCIDYKSQTAVKCPICHIENQSTNVCLDHEFRSEVHQPQIHCSSCNGTGLLSNYQEHGRQHHESATCECCNQRFHSHDQLNQHKLFECSSIRIDCVFKSSGCDEPFLRSNAKEHFLSEKHQRSIAERLRQALLQLNPPPMNAKSSHITTSNNLSQSNDEINDMREALGIISDGVETLVEDTRRLSDESVQMQAIIQKQTEELSQTKLSVEESKASLDAIKYNQDILSQEIVTIEEKMNDFQHVVYDGMLIWRIDNVQEKIRDAESERQTSIYSPPFFSSPTGYTMRARLYLNGDGNARGTHLSLFFVLMRGPFDSILSFPFNYKVTFCLCDQTDAQQHIIDSFRPDKTSSSFQRPRSDMNTASGIPKFCSLDIIRQIGSPYVQNDTMFIKIIVDVEGRYAKLIPFILTLNPGLPIWVQNEAIQSEAAGAQTGFYWGDVNNDECQRSCEETG